MDIGNENNIIALATRSLNTIKTGDTNCIGDVSLASHALALAFNSKDAGAVRAGSAATLRGVANVLPTTRNNAKGGAPLATSSINTIRGKDNSCLGDTRLRGKRLILAFNDNSAIRCALPTAAAAALNNIGLDSSFATSTSNALRLTNNATPSPCPINDVCRDATHADPTTLFNNA